jgi:cobalamin transport system substrate-binding protein
MRHTPLLALAGATVAAAIAAVAITPGGLLPRPERPFEGYGRTDVRIGQVAFPREARGADDVVAKVQSPPSRLVSQAMSTDEYLYSIVPADRIVGVSQTAYQEQISNVYTLARTYQPTVATDVEAVLRREPDLVFTPAEARADVPGLLRAAGVQVYRIPTMFPTLASIEEHIRLVGYLSGEDARAEAELRRFRTAIARAAQRKPAGARAPRVMGFGGTYSYGSQTLFSDILRVLGAENVAATHGFVGYDRVSDEHIVRWNPEWIVAGADRDFVEAVRARLLANPAIAATVAAQRGHVLVLEHQVFLPLSPYTSNLVEALARAFYGAAS